jgi:hypothetical protein
MIKTHCSIVDSSLYEYSSVVRNPIFTILTQQDIAAPLISYYIVSGSARMRASALSLSAVFFGQLRLLASQSPNDALRKRGRASLKEHLSGFTMCKCFRVPNIRKIFTGPLRATVTVLRQQQLCHDDRSFVMNVTHLPLVTVGLSEVLRCGAFAAQ